MKIDYTDQQVEALQSGPGSQAAKDLEIRGTCPSQKIKKDGDEAEGLARAMITTEAVDRDADIVLAEGGKLDNFKNNPVVLFGHNYWEARNIVGRSQEEIVHQGHGIEGAWTWADQVNEEAALVRGLWEGNFLNAISIGFIPHKWEKRKDQNGEELQRGWVFTDWELLEYSVVTVPANQNALRLALNLVGDNAILNQAEGELLEGLQGIQVQQLLDQITQLNKHLATGQAVGTPDPIITDHIAPVKSQAIDSTLAQLNKLVKALNTSLKEKSNHD